jgi:hypothetical protein
MSEDPKIFIPDEDKLFRSVRPDDWDFENNRPRSGVLIGREISVDWSAKRKQEEFLNRENRRNLDCGMLALKAKVPRSYGLNVDYDPVLGNDAHSIIHPKSERMRKASQDRSLVEVLEPPRQPNN